MPRHRFILLLWLTGTVLLLGTWGHSLLRSSSAVFTFSSGLQELRLCVYPGTLAIDVGEAYFPSPSRVRFESIDYKPKSVPGDENALEHVDYFVGPFGEFDWFSNGRSRSLALPLWFLLLLIFVLCLPFYLRARKNVFPSPALTEP